jgi:hypothetical protein
MRQYTVISIDKIDDLDWSIVNEQKETVRYNNSNTAFVVSFDAANSESVLNLSETGWMSLKKAHELMNTAGWLHEKQDI